MGELTTQGVKILYWIKESQKCRSKECIENTLLQRKGYLETIDEGDLSFTSNYMGKTKI